MSKQSKESALKAYPIYTGLTTNYPYCNDRKDVNEYPRKIFQEGYEQAEQDIIGMVVSWLSSEVDNYTYTVDTILTIDINGLIDGFLQMMKNECG